MKRFLLLATLCLTAGFVSWSQWNSLERMGERRFEALKRPSSEVLVGVVWPFAENRDGMADGLMLAKEELAAKGLKFRLLLRDPGYKGINARKIALEFAGTPDLSAVLGYDEKSAAAKAALIYESSRLLCLMIGAPLGAPTNGPSHYVLHTVLTREKITRSLARLLVDRGFRNIALIYEEIAYGSASAYDLRVAFDTLGAALVYQWSYAPEVADFRLPVNELRGINPDIVVFIGLEPWAGKFLRTARGVGLTVPILGAFDDTPELRAGAGRALEGALSVSPYDVQSPSPGNRAFVARFRARYHRDPDAWAAQAYDALHLLAKGFKASGSRNPLDLAYAIRFMAPWEGANGRYKFDKQGNLEDKPLYLNTFRTSP